MEKTLEFREVTQPALIKPSKKNNYFQEVYHLEIDNSSEEIKGQIWSKAVRLYALESEKGEIDPVNYTNRLFASLLNNSQRAHFVEKTAFGKERHFEIPWRGDSIELQYDEESELEGFLINIVPTEEEDNDLEKSEHLQISFTREEFEKSEEYQEIFECILFGLDN